MNWKSVVINLLILKVSISFCLSNGDKISIAKPANWIETVNVNYDSNIKNSSSSDGVFILLMEFKGNAVTNQIYRRKVYKITHSSGIENNSEISINYDPSYQKLVFHTVKIVRNGKEINKLSLSKLKLIQRESDLDKHIYDGSKDAYLILDDVREGDIVEYDYTIDGANPIYDRKFHLFRYLQYEAPVQQIFIKCIYNNKYPLYYKIITSDNSVRNIFSFKDGSIPNSNLSFIELKGKDVPRSVVESHQSEWHTSYPFLIISEYATWQEVAGWSSRIFSLNKQVLPESFKKKLQKWKSNSKFPVSAVDSVLLFVKDSIRYMGIEIGENSIRPSSPTLVLDRRFGDCKDKSVLLASSLNELGFKAYPALVNSYSTAELSRWPPSSHAFNHCIVYVKINGIEYWFDPTITGQRGSFSEMYTPNYKFGLVIDESSTTLKKIEGKRNGRITIKEDFYVPDFTDEVKFKIHTEYSGVEADNQRSYFNSNLEIIKKEYENYYSNQFKNIRITDLSFIDDPITNILKVDEEYLIDSLWVKDSSATNNKVTANFYPLFISSKLNTSSTANRKIPFRLEYPLDLEQKTEIHLPEEWSVSFNPIKFDNKYFTFEQTSKSTGKTVEILTKYRTNAEEVAPEDFKKFNKDQNYIYGNIGIDLTYNFNLLESNDDPNNKNWLLIGMSFMFIILGGVFFHKLYFYNPEPLILEPNNTPINGVLILVAIGLATSPFKIAYDLYFTSNFFNQAAWNYWMEPGTDAYNPALAIIVVFEILYNCLSIVFYVLLNFLFYQRRTSFPRLVIIDYLLEFVFTFMDEILVYFFNKDSVLFDDLSPYYSLAIKLFIWVPYFYYSAQVKHTFSQRI